MKYKIYNFELLIYYSMQPDIINKIDDALEELRKMTEEELDDRYKMLNYKIRLVLIRRRIRGLCKQNETIRKIIELCEIGFFY